MTLKKRRKYWYEIRAWADGWEIERYSPFHELWIRDTYASFKKDVDYRVVPDSEGWLPWYGGECPVDKDTLVDVKTNTRVNGCAGLAAKIWDWDCVTAYRIFKEVDPYAELKAAAKDPTKQIRCTRTETWINSTSDGRQWAFSFSPEEYEIRDKPKPTKKVKLLAWYYPGDNKFTYEENKPGYGWTRVPSEDKEIEIEL